MPTGCPLCPPYRAHRHRRRAQRVYARLGLYPVLQQEDRLGTVD